LIAYSCGARHCAQGENTEEIVPERSPLLMSTSPKTKNSLKARLKNFGKSGFIAKLASALISPWIRFVDFTTRWNFIGREHFEELETIDKGFILAFWHSRLLMVPSVRQETKRRVYMLISAHRDGEIIADAVSGFNINFIRGSTANPKKKFKNKSGATALMQLIAALSEGHIVGITPDGPRGPKHRVQPGIIKLSTMADVPILPIAYATSNGIALNTWDRFFLALPFSKGAFVAGPPIMPPTDGTITSIQITQKTLESALNDALKIAEVSVGHSPSEPKLS